MKSISNNFYNLLGFRLQQSPKASSLQQVIEANDVKKLEGYLSGNSVDVNKPMENGHFPLHVAVRMGHIDMIALLIKQGADFSKLDSDGLSALDYAATNPRKDVLEAILSKESERFPFFSLSKVQTIHNKASQFAFAEKKDIIQIQNQIHTKKQDLSKNIPSDPLSIALHTSNRLGIEDLLQKESTTVQSVHLLQAIFMKDRTLLEKLLNKFRGSLEQTVDDFSFNIIHVAAQENEASILKILIMRGGDLQKKNNLGVSPADLLFTNGAKKDPLYIGQAQVLLALFGLSTIFYENMVEPILTPQMSALFQGVLLFLSCSTELALNYQVYTQLNPETLYQKAFFWTSSMAMLPIQMGIAQIPLLKTSWDLWRCYHVVTKSLEGLRRSMRHYSYDKSKSLQYATMQILTMGSTFYHCRRTILRTLKVMESFAFSKSHLSHLYKNGAEHEVAKTDSKEIEHEVAKTKHASKHRLADIKSLSARKRVLESKDELAKITVSLSEKELDLARAEFELARTGHKVDRRLLEVFQAEQEFSRIEYGRKEHEVAKAEYEVAQTVYEAAKIEHEITEDELAEIESIVARAEHEVARTKLKAWHPLALEEQKLTKVELLLALKELSLARDELFGTDPGIESEYRFIKGEIDYVERLLAKNELARMEHKDVEYLHAVERASLLKERLRKVLIEVKKVKFSIEAPNGKCKIPKSISPINKKDPFHCIQEETEDIYISDSLAEIERKNIKFLPAASLFKERVRQALLNGGKIELFSEGSNGKYKILNGNGEVIALFKPEDEKFGPLKERRADPSYEDIHFHKMDSFEQGMYSERQYLAKILDYGKDANLPIGTIVEMKGEFQTSTGKMQCKRGYLQEWIPNAKPIQILEGDDSELNEVPLNEFQKMGIMDVLLYNQDRSEKNNTLLTEDKHLINIDSDAILPWKLENNRNPLLKLPRASEPFTEASLKIIEEIDPMFHERLAKGLRLPKQSAMNVRLLGSILKRFASAGQSLHDIDQFIGSDERGVLSELGKKVEEATKASLEVLTQEEREKYEYYNQLRLSLWWNKKHENEKWFHDYQINQKKNIDDKLEKEFWSRMNYLIYSKLLENKKRTIIFGTTYIPGNAFRDEMSKIVYANHEEYVKRWDLKHETVTTNLLKGECNVNGEKVDCSPYWNKIKVLKDWLEKPSPDEAEEWRIMTDDDMVVTNMKIDPYVSIDQLRTDEKGHMHDTSLVVTQDVMPYTGDPLTSINTGLLFVRKDSTAKDLVARIWEKRNDPAPGATSYCPTLGVCEQQHTLHEQQAFSGIIQGDPLVDGKVTVVPPRDTKHPERGSIALNTIERSGSFIREESNWVTKNCFDYSSDPDNGKWQVGDWMSQPAGVPISGRYCNDLSESPKPIRKEKIERMLSQVVR